jgi:hypothetical protein
LTDCCFVAGQFGVALDTMIEKNTDRSGATNNDMMAPMPDRELHQFMLELLTASRYKNAVMDRVISVHPGCQSGCRSPCVLISTQNCETHGRNAKESQMRGA